MKNDSMLLDRLAESTVYREYERAFTEATRLPVSLRPVDSWQLPLHCKRNEGPFCAMMAQKSRACAACLQVQQELSQQAAEKTYTLTCPHGMSDTAVPVRMGEQLIGFLQTGQVFQKRPTAAQFERTLKLCREWGLDISTEDLKEAYFKTQVLSSKQYESMVKLLAIFAEHLSAVSNQILTQTQNAEPPVITKAKDFIRQHQADEISLADVAKAVNTSTFYFCKIFKKYTGLNFTDYVSRIRIEKAKSLLLNPNLRISEIAYEVGFQSLTHFNRVFKRVAGQSPTEYRDKLPRVAA
jgi:AraC-like DNA-binding protein/ligand-binding sensor protein